MPLTCGAVSTPVRKSRLEYSQKRNWSGDRGHTTFRHVLGLVACPDSGTTKPMGTETRSNYQSMNQCTRGPCTVPNRDRSKPPRTERDPDMYKSASQATPGKSTLLNYKDARRLEVHAIAAAYNDGKSKFDAMSSRSRCDPDRNETARDSRSARSRMRQSGSGGSGGGAFGASSGFGASGSGFGDSGSARSMLTGRTETSRSTARAMQR